MKEIDISPYLKNGKPTRPLCKRMPPEIQRKLCSKWGNEWTSFELVAIETNDRLPYCLSCNKRLKVHSGGIMLDHCSVKCSIGKREKTNISKYGSKNAMGNNEIKRKKNNTMTAKYGCSNLLLKEEFKKDQIDKRKNTIRKKIEKRCGIKYNDIYDTIFTNEKKTIKEAAEVLGLCYSRVSHMFKHKKGHQISGFSYKELEVCEEISKTYKCERNNRKILDGKEIDIWIPELNVGIEINGYYWHSTEKGTSANYHQDKFLTSIEKNIVLLQFWEDEEVNVDIIHDILKIAANEENMTLELDPMKDPILLYIQGGKYAIESISKPRIVQNKFECYDSGKITMRKL